MSYERQLQEEERLRDAGFEDKELECNNPACGIWFYFAAHEQEFYQSKGYSDPKYCPTCRDERNMSYEERRLQEEERLRDAGFENRDLQCNNLSCGEWFVFPARDQEFYQLKGYSDPKYCPTCRAERKNKPRLSREEYLAELGYEDETLACRDCGEEFVFSAGQQQHFEDKGWPAPVRCRECRENRKAGR